MKIKFGYFMFQPNKLKLIIEQGIDFLVQSSQAKDFPEF